MRTFRTTVEFDVLVAMFQAFTLEDFVAYGLDSVNFTLVFAPVTFRAVYSYDDAAFNYFDDSLDDRLCSQHLLIQYADQLVGELALDEQEGGTTIVALTICATAGRPVGVASFLLAWFRTFHTQITQPSAPPSIAAAQDGLHELDRAGDDQDSAGVATMPASSTGEDLLEIIMALKQGQLEQPTGASADPYIKYYYLSNIREEGSNIGRTCRTAWEDIQKMFEANNPGKIRTDGRDASRTMRELWKKNFDRQHPAFKNVLEQMRALLTHPNP